MGNVVLLIIAFFASFYVLRQLKGQRQARLHYYLTSPIFIPSYLRGRDSIVVVRRWWQHLWMTLLCMTTIDALIINVVV